MAEKAKGLLTRDAHVILFAAFFNQASAMIINPLITGFSASLGVGTLLAGSIGAITSACCLFIRPAAGGLADTVSKRNLALLGSALVGASVLGTAWVQSVPALIALRVISGIGGALSSVCLATWFSRMLPASRLGQGMGLFGLSNAFGMALGPATGVALYQAFGYTPAFLFSGIVACLGACVPLLAREEPPSKEHCPDTAVHCREIIDWASLIDVSALPFALVVMIFALPYMAAQQYLVSYVEARGVSVIVSLFFPVYAIFLFILRLSMGRLFDRVPFRFFLIFSVLSATAAFFLLSIMDSNSIMAAAAFCMAGGYGLMCSVCQSEALKAVGQQRAGSGNATYYMGLDAGMMLGPVVGGALMDCIGVHGFFQALMLVSPVALFVGLWSVRRSWSHLLGERAA